MHCASEHLVRPAMLRSRRFTKQYSGNNLRAVSKDLAHGNLDVEDKCIRSVKTMTTYNERKQNAEDLVCVLMGVSNDQEVQQS